MTSTTDHRHRLRRCWPIQTATAAASLVVAALTAPSALAQPGTPPPAPPVGPLAATPPFGSPLPPTPLLPPPLAALAVPGPVPGQNPTPFVGVPPFRPPAFNPVNGALVGVAKPIIIDFAVPIVDRSLAESAIHISSTPPVPGKFYWMTDRELRWRPLDFWPAGTLVTIDAAGTRSGFRVGDSLIAIVDDATKLMEIVKNGDIVNTFPVSLGKKSYETENGTYYVGEKFADLVMDSSTYGVPVDSPEGYRIDVEDAVRIGNSGLFVHSAPWSVADQGKRNVSHGCINLSPANAQWFYDNFGSGDPVVVKNSVGTYTRNDGGQDWQI